jgi:hypothetical protein
MLKMLRKLLCRCNHSIIWDEGAGILQLGQCQKCQRYWLYSKEYDYAIVISAAKADEVKKIKSALGK